MKHRLKLSLLGLCLSAGTTFAQQSVQYTHPEEKFYEAISLYNHQQYYAAQQLFKSVDAAYLNDLKGDAAYYVADCAVRLKQPNADVLMQDFVNSYPNNTHRNSAYGKVANYYFDAGNYKKAEQWYAKVDVYNLSKKEQEELNFNKAYTYFRAGDKEKAKVYFNRVLHSEQYADQAKYYLGFMAYEGEDYQQADQLFQEVKSTGGQGKNMAYFQSDMSFKQGKFQEAINLAKEQLATASISEKSELNKIIGESYFNLKEYEAAIPYLKQYRGKKGKWNNTDYYQLGYAYYKQAEFQKAVNEFNKIIGGNDVVAQNAYYHLAESYIKLAKKQQALNAFKNASEMNFNEKIQEDAALNYAKLSYEIGNSYKSIPEVLTSFIKKYPNNSERDTIEELLVDSYVTAKNYEAALLLLEGSNAYKDKKVYQKVAYFRAIELYNEANYKRASQLFEKSLAQPVDSEFTAKATFWKAEAAYNLNEYDAALIGYKEFKRMPAAKTALEYKSIEYNLGYAYFKKRNYPAAITHFKAYTKTANQSTTQLNDAWLRLGDSYFANSNYWPAMEAYNKAIAMKDIDSDYAYFQKAISYGFVERNQRKIEDLEAFLKKYKKSIYRDDALYELGNTYVAEGNTTKGLKAYQQLIKEQPKSNFIAKTMLKEGLIYYNSDQNEQALTQFKKVAKNYPNTNEATQAVTTARNIYIDLGKTNEYAAWVKTLDYVEVSDADIDNTAFEAAEKQFVNNQTEKAKTSLIAYLNQFPNGIHALEANFYLAQLYYRASAYQEAIPYYQEVLNKNRNQFTEQALARIGEIYLTQKNYKKAIPVLKELEEVADFQQNISFSQSNLMKAYYEQEQYQQTLTYAEKVLADAKAAENAKTDAQLFIARAAMKTNNEAKAEKAYAEVQKKATGILAAEAHYYQAYFQHKSGNYEASNQAVQVLARDYSSYQEYGSKGLLLMAKNFNKLGDAYQATYILESLINNFKQYPEVVKEAEQELIRIKTEAAKTNASVKPQED